MGNRMTMLSLLLLGLLGCALGRVALPRALCSLGMAVAMVAPIGPLVTPMDSLHIESGIVAHADDKWDDRNRLAAEAWRVVDSLYYDRNFNHQDWFGLRKSIVKKSYHDDQELYTSIKEMLMKLDDKYTKYLTPSQYNVILNSALGELTGVGIELLPLENGDIKINNVYDESPAKESGLSVGDIIVNVDGTDIKSNNLSPEEVASLLRGKKGTKASVRIKREDKILDYTVIRQPFKIKSVIVKNVVYNNKNVGIITIKSFSSTTRDDVTTGLEQLYDKNKPDYLVIDMRNNGGGLLQGAVETSNLFMNPGKIIVYVVDAKGKTAAEQTLPGGVVSTNPNLPDVTTPLYVLVNGNTASAAEVLAAALKENNRGTLVGSKTFGKGVIQTLQELRQGGISVTIAKYETPNHNNINKIGINVDQAVDCVEDNVEKCISQFIK